MCVDKMTIRSPERSDSRFRKRTRSSGSSRRLVDNQQLRVVEERLGDAHALLHTAGEATQWPLPGLPQVDNLKQPVDSAASRPPIQPLDCSQVFEELDGIDVGIRTEILGQVPKNGAHLVRVAYDIDPVPRGRALGRACYCGQYTHQGRLAGAIGANQTRDAWLE